MNTPRDAVPRSGEQATTPAGPSARVLPTATVGTGIALMLAAQLLVMPVSDAVVKHLAASLPVAQLAWARFFFNFLLLAPAALWYHRRRILAPPRPALQLLRGVLVVAANLLFIAGVRLVPLADAIAVTFVAPLAVAALSPLVLRERVGPTAWVAVAVGFLGALVVIRPGLGATSLAALLPLGAGLAFAAYHLVTRKLAGTSPPLVTQTATAAVGAALTTLTLPLVWKPPSPSEWALMLVVGTASCAGHLLITTAHEHARAATLAPLTYASIVSAAALGYLFFGDWPDALTWLGAGIVIASGLTIWRYSGRS
jgi:drug/metabolite transporter (DMT)-like permease